MLSPERLPASTTLDRHAALVNRALAHIDAHLDQPLDAPTLADRAALSRHHFHRVFAAQVGCSVGSYVTWRRLQRACALLVSGREPVLEVALAVGFESSQALAKALRRELGTSASAVRRGDLAVWSELWTPWRAPGLATPVKGNPMEPTRYADLPAGLWSLTATARGMVQRTLTRAAQQAYGELMPAVARAGLMPRLRSCISLCPDDAQGPDDPQCRFVAGVVFGYALADGSGQGERPDLALTGTLAWQALAPGRHAVFAHVGPYDQLYRSWHAIYHDWLPTCGETLRDDPPLEVMLNDASQTPAAELRTEIWIPLR